MAPLQFGAEARLALSLASASLLSHPGDAERAARMICSALGWSLARARWFIEVNRERLPSTAELAEELPGDVPGQA
jgi:hypothetical protein